MGRVDWGTVSDEALATFSGFQDDLVKLAQEDSRLKLELVQKGQKLPLVQAYVSGVFDPSRDRPDLDTVNLNAYMNEYNTSALLWLWGGESWVFEKSEKIVRDFSSILLQLVVNSGFTPFPGIRRQSARRSVWNQSWALYTRSHPKVLSTK